MSVEEENIDVENNSDSTITNINASDDPGQEFDQELQGLNRITMFMAILMFLVTSKIYIGLFMLVDITSVVVGVIHLAMYWSTTCNYSINTWLVIYIACDALNILYAIISLRLKPDSKLVIPIYIINKVKQAFWLSWFIYGNTLYWNNPNCESQLYKWVYARLIISYIEIGIPFLLVIVLICILCTGCISTVLSIVSEGPSGATQEQIDKLEIIQCTTELISSLNECPICVEDYTLESTLRKLPCNHMIHKECIDNWFKINATCPMCRKSIIADEQPNENIV
jgi:hypothetical protein